MAVYATIDDLQLAIGEEALKSIAGDGVGGVDSDKVSAALADASAIADGYILVTYPSGVVTVPTALKRAVIMIANQLLRLSEQSTEDSRLGFKNAIDWLVMVSKGTAILPGQPVGDDGVISPGDPLIVAGDRIWNRKTVGMLF